VLHGGSSDVIENPRVIVEVLSKSTEQYDRGDEWDDYRSIASLTDYVLISQRFPGSNIFLASQTALGDIAPSAQAGASNERPVLCSSSARFTREPSIFRQLLEATGGSRVASSTAIRSDLGMRTALHR
jgi:Uma2 family endonuclease